MGKKETQYFLKLVFLFFAIPLLFSSVSLAQNDLPKKNYETLRASVAETLKAELKEIENLKSQLNQAEQSQKRILEDNNNYKIQLPILNNLLIQPETTVKDLEKSGLEIQAAIRDLSGQIDAFSARQNTVSPLIAQTRDQITLTENQVVEIKSDATTGKEISGFTDQLQILLNYLSEKQKLLTSQDIIYSSIIEALGEKKTKFKDLSDRFDKSIIKKKKQDLLERKTSLVSIGLKQIFTDFKQIHLQLEPLASKSFWEDQLKLVWPSGSFYSISFILLFLIVQILIYRIRQYIVRIKDHPALKERFWTLLTLSTVKKSIFLLCSTLFIYVYAQIGPLQSKPPIIWGGLNILLVWLFSEICIDALKTYCGEEATTVPRKPAFSLRLLISYARWFGLSYIFFSWLNVSNTILTVWRLAFEICLYTWMIFFWKKVQDAWPKDFPDHSRTLSATIISIKFLSFAIVLIALILELTGYGLLSLYWFTSWGRTVVVALWSFLFFCILREWNPKIVRNQDTDVMHETPKNSIRWVVVQFLTLAWIGGVVILLVLAWGGKQAVLLWIFEFLKHTYQVGTMRFSLMGFIIATLVLMMTKAITRVWQHLFREQILEQSGMEEGLQESITTISVYVIWSIGILIALTVFGFNATTLTVVLGALGIGLGFGLQTIFNNFISGIILLFERPIQVGDDIEVNGIWARVRKINVRSTLVQTFDNASLIIPNSDLISSQVTNWSFKDKRLRRTVEVGVAYGSDIELVRKTLFEVAEKTPRVYKVPKPDVIFKSFGDNSLIFLLRFWTRVEYFLAVETDVRFEIDRLFRERNIEIAFPQMDIHIRSDFKEPKEGNQHKE